MNIVFGFVKVWIKGVRISEGLLYSVLYSVRIQAFMHKFSGVQVRYSHDTLTDLIGGGPG